LLDEPTKGVDISAKKDILNIIKNELSKYAGIILTTPSLDDMIEVCDRILVLCNGRLSYEITKNNFREAELYLAIQGGDIENACKLYDV
jgi:ABC-type sugar transport system ATPase subunit